MVVWGPGQPLLPHPPTSEKFSWGKKIVKGAEADFRYTDFLLASGVLLKQEPETEQ